MSEQQKPNNEVVGLSCLALVVLVIVLVLLGAYFGGGDEDDPDGGGEFGARDVCEQFVKDRLKSPSTADFSDTAASPNGLQSWTVLGAVDSENSFGAMIRNTYICTVHHTAGDNWALDDLQLSGN